MNRNFLCRFQWNGLYRNETFNGSAWIIEESSVLKTVKTFLLKRQTAFFFALILFLTSYNQPFSAFKVEQFGDTLISHNEIFSNYFFPRRKWQLLQVFNTVEPKNANDSELTPDFFKGLKTRFFFLSGQALTHPP